MKSKNKIIQADVLLFDRQARGKKRKKEKVFTSRRGGGGGGGAFTITPIIPPPFRGAFVYTSVCEKCECECVCEVWCG